MGLPILIFIFSLGITYFLIMSAVKTAISESTDQIKDAVKEGILEALAERDNRKKADNYEL
jgi:hypothetical protein